jgi:hypothetical protein
VRGCIALQDGRLLLAGFAYASGNSDLLLARLTTNGELDTALAAAGFSRIDLGGSESAQSIIRLADGDLALTGSTAMLQPETSLTTSPIWGYEMPGTNSDVLFARIDADSGSLDPDFGNDGLTRVDFGETASESIAFGRRILLQADGKLVAVGARAERGDWWNTYRLALTRVDPAGTGNAGVASFAAGYIEVTEGGAPATFSVRRTGGSTGVLTVGYTTVAQTAVAPGDFTAVSGTLTWASGDVLPKSVTVPITNDGDREDFEYFTIDLTGADPHVGLDNLWVSIRNDDVPPPPVPPPGAPPQAGGSSGGGGAAGLEVLLLLAMVGGVARRFTARWLTR